MGGVGPHSRFTPDSDANHGRGRNTTAFWDKTLQVQWLSDCVPQAMCHERLLSRCPLTSAMCFLTWPTMTMTFPRKLGSRAVCGPWLSSPSAVKAVLNGMLMLPEMWPRIKLRRKRLRKTLCLHLWVWERPLQGSRRSLTQLGHLSLHQKSGRHGRKSDA